MRYIDADTVKRTLLYAELVAALRRIYANKGLAARRELMDISAANGCRAPAWPTCPPSAQSTGHDITTKIFTVFLDNKAQRLPTVNAVVLVFDAGTGRLKALVDGTELTRRQTVAMSALASTYLSQEDTRTLTVCEAGAHLDLVGRHDPKRRECDDEAARVP